MTLYKWWDSMSHCIACSVRVLQETEFKHTILYLTTTNNAIHSSPPFHAIVNCYNILILSLHLQNFKIIQIFWHVLLIKQYWHPFYFIVWVMWKINSLMALQKQIAATPFPNLIAGAPGLEYWQTNKCLSITPVTYNGTEWNIRFIPLPGRYFLFELSTWQLI